MKNARIAIVSDAATLQTELSRIARESELPCIHIIQKNWGRNTDYFSHLLNTLRPPRNRGFQLCFAVTKHTRRRSSKIWNQKRFSEAEFKRLGFLSTALALLSYISQGHCPRPLRRFERSLKLSLKKKVRNPES